MILVDSSTWIDFFRGTPSPQADRLEILLGNEPLLIGDIILTEVLQGFTSDRDFNRGHALLQSLEFIEIDGPDVAVEAARNFRTLRAKGVTVRKTIDTLIATRCIVSGLTLLHNDRAFDPFVERLGLRVLS